MDLNLEYVNLDPNLYILNDTYLTSVNGSYNYQYSGDDYYSACNVIYHNIVSDDLAFSTRITRFKNIYDEYYYDVNNNDYFRIDLYCF